MATSCACAAMIHKQITLGEGELNEQKLRLGTLSRAEGVGAGLELGLR